MQRFLDRGAKIWFSSLLLLVIALYVLRGVYAHPLSASAWLGYSLLTTSAIALVIDARSRIVLFLLTLPSGFTLFIINGVLEYQIFKWAWAIEFRDRGDPRTSYEVIDDLRDEGIDAVGVRCTVMNAANHEGGVLPLAGWPFKYTVLGNENGYYASYYADRHGFNNPDSVYDQRHGRASAVMLGDSFAQGVAVDADDNASAVLRRSGIDVLNLGCAGNGPLSQLGSYEEYGRPFKPQVVVWFYLESNDLLDLRREWASILRNYLEPGFTQNLAQRPAEIAAFLGEIAVPSRQQRMVTHLYRLVALVNVRNMITSAFFTPGLQGEVDRFRMIMRELRRRLEQEGTKMLVAYLPDGRTMARGSRSDDCTDTGASCKSLVMALFAEESVPVIDFEETLDELDDPLSVFTFRMDGDARGHFTPEGYRLLGNAIAKKLGEMGI